MGTTVQWTKCWLLLTVISNIYSTGDIAENLIGTEVEFSGLGSGENWREIEENNYINLTVHLNGHNFFQIKLSQQQNNLSVDLCKFTLKTTCEMSDSTNATSHCQCLNNHTVQFLKKASRSDSGLYTWKWRHGKTPDKQRDIFINVKEVIGTEVEFGGVGPEQNSTEIEENNYINLTVHLNGQNIFQIKLSHQQNNLSVDLCKFGLKTTCEVSDSSNATSHCQCINNNTVQFLKKASSSDSGLYTWRWRDGRTADKQRDIFITVIKANTSTGSLSDDTAMATTTTIIICVSVSVVVVATACLVFCLRGKSGSATVFTITGTCLAGVIIND